MPSPKDALEDTLKAEQAPLVAQAAKEKEKPAQVEGAKEKEKPAQVEGAKEKAKPAAQQVQVPCFKKGTLVSTDQGEIAVEDLSIKYTINKHKIKDIIKSLNNSSPMITINKGALDGHLPTRNVTITCDHLVMYQDRWVSALDLCHLDNVVKEDANNDMVYNILLKKHSYVMVAGMVIETMNPRSLKLVGYKSEVERGIRYSQMV